ncbi:hypothetical protein [Tumebacillus permanentifrigoris]|uniref:Uncharacterized protein n=1 Tax=Tumebacillus permanentifrigoris TaxID=378543 RepID=A0A316D2E3_9BACL|nr:hypothetical protein [Tumebacillus permanentifrigoris]PWK03948.1 hypothetical protein C7459_1384 [Tumebacillus permanentifrigoris]
MRKVYRNKNLFKIPKCPNCKRKTLYIEYDDSEYSLSSWVACEDCGHTEDVEKLHAPLNFLFGYGEHSKHFRRNSKTKRKRRQMVGGKR